MTATPGWASLPRLPDGACGAVRGRLRRFAREARHGATWRRLDELATDPDLPGEEAVCGAPAIVGNREVLRRVLRGGLPRAGAGERPVALSLEGGTEELWSFAATLDEDGRRALDVVVRRALDPLEALATWPPETFFSTEELAHLGTLPRAGGAPDVFFPIEWAPGGDAHYPGYACAIVKFTRRCNLRCVYCHDWREGPDQAMDFPTQALLFQRLLGARDHAMVDVVWHGGEPTLVGGRAFLRVLALQRWFRRPGQRIGNVLQTNGTLLDTPWAHRLLRYRVRVGVSLDGPAALHDRLRFGIGGRPSFAQVRRGLATLQEAGLQAGAILVVGEEVARLGGDAVWAFLQDLGVGGVAFLPVRPGNTPDRSDDAYLALDRYIGFLLEVHSARRERPQPAVRVRELDAALDALAGRMPGYCEMLGNCVGSFFSVDVDGSVAHCDKYVGDPAYTLGNLRDSDFDELRAGPRLQELAAQSRREVAAFADCPHYAGCRGWCPHERYLVARLHRGEGATCCGLAPLFEALKEDARALASAAPDACPDA